MKPSQNWLLPGLLLMQGLFLGETFGTLTVTMIFFVCFGLLAMWRARLSAVKGVPMDTVGRSFASQLGWGVFLMLDSAIVCLWRFRSHFGDTFNPVAYFFDAFAHVCFVLGMLFFVRRPRDGHPAMLGLGLLVVMLAAASGASSHSLASQITISVLACVAFLFASRFILHSWYRDQRRLQLRQRGATTLSLGTRLAKQSAASVGPAKQDHARIGWLFSVVMLSAFLTGTGFVANATSTMLPEVQRIVHDHLKSSFDATSQDINIGSTHYVSGSRLGAILWHKTADPTGIALRAHSGSTPGYLRGHVFDDYAMGRWNELSESTVAKENPQADSFETRVIEPSGVATTRIEGLAMRRLRRFDFSDSEVPSVATVQIQNDPLKGRVWFTPLSTRWIEAQARSIYLGSHNVVEHGINARFPYVAGVAFEPTKETLGPIRTAALTNVDDSVIEPIDTMAKEICEGHLTNTAKAKAIAKHFQEQYEYSMQGVPVPGRGDPLVHFLNTKHPAHCELFASASVLMLRSVGVPSRYVTGYVCEEFNTEEGCWLARHRDAHAWAEAYDDVTETWFPVESTPGRAYQTLAIGGSEDNSLGDAANDADDVKSENSSIVSRAVGWLLSNRATDPLTLIIQIGQWPLLFLGLFMLWRRLRRGGENKGNPDDVRSRQMLATVDRKLHKMSLNRSPNETLHQFAARLEEQAECAELPPHGDSQLLCRYAKWYREFAEARYQGQMPTPFLVV